MHTAHINHMQVARIRQRNSRGSFVRSVSHIDQVQPSMDNKDLIFAGRKMEYRNQTEVRERKARTEFYGGFRSQRKWDDSRFHIGFEDTKSAQVRKLPDDPKKEWGFDADDIKDKLESQTSIKGLVDDYHVWAQLAKDLGNSVFQELPQNGTLVKQLLRATYPRFCPRYTVPTAANVQNKWGFTLDDIVHALDGNVKYSCRSLATKLANARFKVNTKRGYYLKQFLLEQGQEDLIKQIEVDKPTPHNPKRRRIDNDGVPVVVDPSARKICTEFCDEIENNPELKAELFGNVTPTTVTMKRAKRCHDGTFKLSTVTKQLDMLHFPIRKRYSNTLQTPEAAKVLEVLPPETHYILIRSWWDGSPLGRLPSFKVLDHLQLSREDLATLTDAEATELIKHFTKRQTSVMCPASETAQTYKKIGSDVGRDWKTLKEPFLIGKKTIYLRPNLQICDVKGMRMLTGTQCGGYYGCVLCYIHKNDHHSLTTGLRTSPRDWLQTLKKVPESSRKLGDVDWPAWLSGETIDPLTFDPKEYCLEFVEPGLCILHIIEGYSPQLFKLLVKEVDPTQKQDFEALVKQWMGRSDASLQQNMTTRDWRDFWALGPEIFKDCFFKHLSPCKLQSIKTVLHTFGALCCNFYLRFAERTPKSILRVHVLIWKHTHHVQIVFPPNLHPKLYKTHFHQLCCHVGFLFRRHPIFDLNGELEEATWKDDRFIEVHLSNHQQPMQNIRK